VVPVRKIDGRPCGLGKFQNGDRPVKQRTYDIRLPNEEIKKQLRGTARRTAAALRTKTSTKRLSGSFSAMYKYIGSMTVEQRDRYIPIYIDTKRRRRLVDAERIVERARVYDIVSQRG